MDRIRHFAARENLTAFRRGLYKQFGGEVGGVRR